MNQQRSKPGPKPKQWAALTWVNKCNGSEMTIEADDKRHCKEMFLCNVADPKEWRLRR